jgi:hypothetical protein
LENAAFTVTPANQDSHMTDDDRLCIDEVIDSDSCSDSNTCSDVSNIFFYYYSREESVDKRDVTVVEKSGN